MAGKRAESTFRAGIGKMTDEEIGLEITSLRGQHFALRGQMVTGKVEDLSQFGIAKRNVARLMTEQNARRKAKAEKAAK